MNKFVKCIKLMKYGRQSKISIILAAAAVVIGIISSVVTLFNANSSSGSDTDLWMGMPFYFAAAILTTPINSFSYKRQFLSSSVRKFAEIWMLPIMLAAVSSVMLCIIALITAISPTPYAVTIGSASILFTVAFSSLCMVAAVALVKLPGWFIAVDLIFVMYFPQLIFSDRFMTVLVSVAKSAGLFGSLLIGIGCTFLMAAIIALVNFILYKNGINSMYMKSQNVTWGS